jgi:hypothetical protein
LLDVNGTARINGVLQFGSTPTLESFNGNTMLKLTASLGLTISSDRWNSNTSSASYIQNGYSTKSFVIMPTANANYNAFDFSAGAAFNPTLSINYNQKLINGAMTINSTGIANFFGLDSRTTDNSASIANNVYAIYADATLGTNTSATRWAGYFVGRGYFSGDVGIGTTSPTAKLHVVYAPAVIGATFTSARIVAGSGQVNQTATALSLESSGTNGGEAIYTGLNVSANSRTVITGVNSVVSKNWGGATLAGNAIGVFGSATTDSSSGVAYGGSFVGVSNAGTTYGLYANVTGSGTRIPFAVAVSGTEAMRVSSSSNLLVGTTTDAGYKLDVNGTARATSFLSTGKSFKFNDSGTQGQFASDGTDTYIDFVGAMRWRRGGGGVNFQFTSSSNFLIGISETAGYPLQVGGSGLFSNNQNGSTSLRVSNTTSGNNAQVQFEMIGSGGNFLLGKYSALRTPYKILSGDDSYLINQTIGDISILNDFSTGAIKFGAGGTSTAQMILTSGGNVGIGTTSPNASALLDITSTTKGFLPPRMTTTQKNAIATPATGLVVYDTTLNKLSVYTGAGWETVTSV